MSGYVLGRRAEQDLDDFWEYMAQDSVDAADRVIAEIFQAFELVSRNPHIGHKRGDLTKRRVRFWPVGNYLIIYRAPERVVEAETVPRRR